MSLLNVEHLSKFYGDKDSLVTALNDVSFQVEEGEFICIVGASGCGKSTLLHILGGVDQASSGRVIINGVDIGALNTTQSTVFRRKNIGLIYQFYNLIPVLNVEENITLPLALDKQPIHQTEVEKLMTMFNLSERKKHLPSQLSGGQQQRTAIARALINKPAIILADEPTGNLDQKNSKEIISYLKEINASTKQTILLVTHDMTIAKQAKRILTMEDGKIVKDEVN